MKHFLALAFCGAIGGLALSSRGEKSPEKAPGETARVARRVADLPDARIDESSGLAASRAFPGFLWTHNDSGDGARAFLLNAKTGATKTTISLRDAKAIDWEDCAVGTGDGKTWLYLGDIGDNARARPSITIYRVPENNVEPDTAEQTLESESQILKYPDGAHDAETLLAAPGEKLIVISKGVEGSSVYITPQPFRDGSEQTLKKLGEIKFGGASFFARLATGGSVSADNRRLVIRTYTHAHEWTLAPDEDVESGWWQRAPKSWALPVSSQGEGIAYANDNRTLFTTSEKLPAPLDEIAVKNG